MGLFDFKKKQKIEQKTVEEQRTLSESDDAILANAIEKGIPCISFIPINELRKSLSIIKPEGLKGYFIAKIPALYPDGTIKYLLKEEFMLWNAANNAIRNIENKGGTYFFIGFEMLVMTKDNTHEYLNPQIFYQVNNTLFRVDTDEKLEFFNPIQSPSLDLTYIPTDHNIHFHNYYVVNLLLTALKYPLEEREDPSGFMVSYEQWKNLKYPLEGDELQALFNRSVQAVKKLLR